MNLIIWLLMMTIYLCADGREVIFSGKKVLCKEYNQDYFSNITCGIKLVSRYKQTYSLSVNYKAVTLDHWHVRMKSYYKFRTVYRPIGVNLEENVCEYLKHLNGTKVVGISNFKNLPEELKGIQCPIKGPGIIDVKGIEMAMLRLPAWAPIGDWYFDTISYTIVDEKEIFLVKLQNYFETSYKYD